MYWSGIFFIELAWINNYMPIKVWDEIKHPFLNFNNAAIEVGDE